MHGYGTMGGIPEPVASATPVTPRSHSGVINWQVRGSAYVFFLTNIYSCVTLSLRVLKLIKCSSLVFQSKPLAQMLILIFECLFSF